LQETTPLKSNKGVRARYLDYERKKFEGLPVPARNATPDQLSSFSRHKTKNQDIFSEQPKSVVSISTLNLRDAIKMLRQEIRHLGE
jgi:hypothetical protein